MNPANITPHQRLAQDLYLLKEYVQNLANVQVFLGFGLSQELDQHIDDMKEANEDNDYGLYDLYRNSEGVDLLNRFLEHIEYQPLNSMSQYQKMQLIKSIITDIMKIMITFDAIYIPPRPTFFMRRPGRKTQSRRRR